MRIKLHDVSFEKQANEAVIAIYKDRSVYVSLYPSYRLNREEAIRQLNKYFDSNMKTLNKDNFMAAAEAYADEQSHDKDEYYDSDASLAKDFLEGFYNKYFEIDLDKDARRVQYLKLKEEFGNE